jgi:hypothetical protein
MAFQNHAGNGSRDLTAVRVLQVNAQVVLSRSSIEVPYYFTSYSIMTQEMDFVLRRRSILVAVDVRCS